MQDNFWTKRVSSRVTLSITAIWAQPRSSRPQPSSLAHLRNFPPKSDQVQKRQTWNGKNLKTWQNARIDLQIKSTQKLRQWLQYSHKSQSRKGTIHRSARPRPWVLPRLNKIVVYSKRLWKPSRVIKIWESSNKRSRIKSSLIWTHRWIKRSLQKFCSKPHQNHWTLVKSSRAITLCWASNAWPSRNLRPPHAPFNNRWRNKSHR